MEYGMDKVYPNLYVGSLYDSKDKRQIEANQITHILSIHDGAKEGNFKHIKYLCLKAKDSTTQDIQQYFSQAINFIHEARINGGTVLIHCLAGVSRSPSIATAYIMTVSNLNWLESMNAVRGARVQACPNPFFQEQLELYEKTNLQQEKENLIATYGQLNVDDMRFARHNLKYYNDKMALRGEDEDVEEDSEQGDVKSYENPIFLDLK